MAQAFHRRVTADAGAALVYVPLGSGPHPVLLFLHGAGESAEGRSEQLARLAEHRSPVWLAEQGSPYLRQYLLIAPQLEQRRRWEPEDRERIDALVLDSARDHGADLERLTLTGFSLGGEGVFQVASGSRLGWSQLWAVDPALQRLPPAPALSVRVWVHYGLHQPGAVNMKRFGDQLGLEPPGSQRLGTRIVKALREDHPNTCKKAYADGTTYDWLAMR